MAKKIEFDTRLKHPFTAMVCGPTGCGKTEWVFKLLRNRSELINPPPERVIWCFGIFQDAFRKSLLSDVEFYEGIPDLNMLDSRNTLIILDDLMSEADERVTKLFTKGSHHKNASVIYITQNVFHKGKQNRDISLNTHYLILFKNPRDNAQIAHLGRQIFPNKSKHFSEAFCDATSVPYGYLFIDLKPNTPDELRLRANVFPEENQIAYVYK